MVVTTEIGTGQLAELVKQVQDGNEVLLTQGDKLVARLIPARADKAGNGAALRVRSLTGHRVLTPIISQAELADDIFERL
jgi:antitoxin (DNA-binding transcriptional repressor) of toxin-antitoxin stability system